MRDLLFPELRRAAQALSAVYVEKRHGLDAGAALGSAGKRAAFALYFAPLHFAVVDHVVRALEAHSPALDRVLELGCGTLTPGAAWACACAPAARLEGVDKNKWVVEEARFTLRAFGLVGSARQGDLLRVALPGANNAILAAFTLNELADAARDRLGDGLLRAARAGARVLIVEPVAKRVSPWWDAWSRRFVDAGGRRDLWTIPIDRPPLIARLDKATRLDHRLVKARTLYLACAQPAVGSSAAEERTPNATNRRA